jgi:hypothetical protein
LANQEKKEPSLDTEGWFGTAEEKPGEEAKAAQSRPKSGAVFRRSQPFVEKLNEIPVGISICVLAGQRDALAAGEFQFAAEDGWAVVSERNDALPSMGTKKPDLCDLAVGKGGRSAALI